MRTSESITNLIPALIAARRQFAPVVKQAKGQVGKDREYFYADLGTLLASTMPPLMDQGLAILQVIDAETATLVTRLVHTSGEWCESAYPLKLDLSPQQFGSLLTYGRRYSLQSLLCLAAEDDDGAGAQPAEPPAKRKAAALAKLPPKGPVITDEQRRNLFAIAEGAGWSNDQIKVHLQLHFGIDSTKALEAAKYDQVCKAFSVPPIAPEEMPL